MEFRDGNGYVITREVNNNKFYLEDIKPDRSVKWTDDISNAWWFNTTQEANSIVTSKLKNRNNVTIIRDSINETAASPDEWFKGYV